MIEIQVGIRKGPKPRTVIVMLHLVRITLLSAVIVA